MSLNKVNGDFVDLNIDNYLPKITTASIADQGWRIYNDSSAIPVDGTGGTTTGLTFAPDTNTILTGVANLRLSKDASNRQGLGVSKDFTVNNNHLGRVLQFTFDAKLDSGTYSIGDIKIYFIQDPTGTPVVLEPVNVQLQLGIAGNVIKHIATFQTDITLKNYRLCYHVASTSASAYTIDFNNFKIWEPNQNYGAIITDWQSYTPNYTNLGTSPSSNLFWRRNGSNLEIFGRLTLGSSLPGSGGDVGFPGGLVAKSSVMDSGYQRIGFAIRGSGLANQVNIITNSLRASFTFSAEGTANALTPQTMGSIFNDSEVLSINLSVPIEGWGSNLSLSSDAGDGREVSAILRTPTASTINSTTPLIMTVKDYDSMNIYNTSTGVITIPVAGRYRISTTGGYDFSSGYGTPRIGSETRPNSIILNYFIRY